MLVEGAQDYVVAWYFFYFYDAIEFVIGCFTCWLFLVLQAWLVTSLMQFRLRALMAEAPRSAESKASEVHRPGLVDVWVARSSILFSPVSVMVL